ncbi:nucleoside triphosphate pyrophosphohydrolase family protein [Candidatus Saccharibacteria bacterium]|nr:nucleoside triphosphate pyrophosphohydrolase family protein [Candidatus Saccharibacteria bacterium]MBR3264237.1 nucleoside triphosphate pyrophosphohydrolase family protein [Candidatus Saccharibacteria bacterium]
MGFDEYQERAKKYDSFEKTEDLKAIGFIEKVLGITGEAGETADKIKKILRDKDGSISDEDRLAISKELGDVLWYLAGVARYLDIPFSEVAKGNLEKLESRWQRNKIHGEGDER